MTCPTCSAAVLAPLVEGGVSISKITERARRAAENLNHAERGAIEELCNVATLLAAELAHRPAP